MRDEIRLSISLFCAKMSNKVPTYSLSLSSIRVCCELVGSVGMVVLWPVATATRKLTVRRARPENYSTSKSFVCTYYIIVVVHRLSSISTIFFCRKIPLGRNTATDAGCTATKVMVEWTWRKCTTLLRNTKWLAKFSLLSRLWMGDIVMC